jgi:hypothetical protein
MIVKLVESPKQNKRYRVYMDNGKYWDFGYKNDITGDFAYTYIDGASVTTKKNYLKRHLGNPREQQLIENLVPSASLFSAFLLWGKYRDIAENVRFLNKLWKEKHSMV